MAEEAPSYLPPGSPATVLAPEVNALSRALHAQGRAFEALRPADKSPVTWAGLVGGLLLSVATSLMLRNHYHASSIRTLFERTLEIEEKRQREGCSG